MVAIIRPCGVDRSNARPLIAITDTRGLLGLGSSLEQASDGAWIAETPAGRATIRFSEPNAFGVLDHTVVPAPGMEIYVPLRVVANGDAGSEILLTLFRQPGMSDEKFAADAAWVLRDLRALKALLEA